MNHRVLATAVASAVQSLFVSVVDIIDIESSESHADVIVYRTSSTLYPPSD